MKIYCILFDTVPRHPKIKNVLEKKDINFADHITCSSTVPTLVTMLSGNTPTEMFGIGGIGNSHTQQMVNLKRGGFSRNKVFVVKNPDGFRLLPDDLCGRTRNMNFYQYNKNKDEDDFMKDMQELPDDENNFILLNKIDFDEPDSLFWIFADHGEPPNIGKLMQPPDSWLAWCGIKDNITNKKINKKIIGCDDFKNSVLNRIYNKNLPNDILDDLDMDRIYVREDGRGAIDPNYGTTVSAIKALDEDRYIQYVNHSPQASQRTFNNLEERTIIYNKSKDEIENVGPDKMHLIWTIDNNFLKKHLLDGPWGWFFRKTADE